MLLTLAVVIARLQGCAGKFRRRFTRVPAEELNCRLPCPRGARTAHLGRLAHSLSCVAAMHLGKESHPVSVGTGTTPQTQQQGRTAPLLQKDSGLSAGFHDIGAPASACACVCPSLASISTTLSRCQAISPVLITETKVRATTLGQRLARYWTNDGVKLIWVALWFALNAAFFAWEFSSAPLSPRRSGDC